MRENSLGAFYHCVQLDQCPTSWNRQGKMFQPDCELFPESVPENGLADYYEKRLT